MISTIVDVNRVRDTALARRAAWEKLRLKPALIQLFDGNYSLRGEVAGERAGGFTFEENETGTAHLKMPLDHYLAKWVMDFKGRAKRNVHVVFQKQGARWSGFMDNYKIVRTKAGDRFLEINFKHDFEHLKHIYVWANPFLPAEFQFPKVWMLFGPAKWCLSLTLLINIARLENSWWGFADDPMDQDIPGISTWRMAVKPFSILDDNSNVTTVFSRFKTFFDTAKRALADAQLMVECRRYLPHLGDEPPWEGANLRPGCLVWEIVDKSGWKTQTSFGGNLLTGLERSFVTIASDGYTEGIDVITGDPTFPDEYYIPGWQGTRPSAPWVVFEEGMYTGIESSEFTYYEATDTRAIAGGHSMPGVNEGLSAAVNAAFDAIAALIVVPPAGGTVDAILRPLYTDVILAFMWHGFNDRAEELGDFHLYEGWADGSDRAYTLGSWIALRAKRWQTRQRTAHTIKVSDAAPYRLGTNGQGHLWLGDRCATSVLGWPVPDQLFVERVSKISYEWDENGPKGWQMDIGYQEPNDPVLKLFEEVQEVMSGLHDLGLV